MRRGPAAPRVQCDSGFEQLYPMRGEAAGSEPEVSDSLGTHQNLSPHISHPKAPREGTRPTETARLACRPRALTRPGIAVSIAV